MKLLKPLHYSPKQWIAFCNTFLLSLVTFMCGLVIYEISILDRRFISVMDSSTVASDLLAVNLVNSYKSPFWRYATDGISVYSAFYDINKEDVNHIIIIGSFSTKEILTGVILCLIDYADDGDLGLEHVDAYKVVLNQNTIFLYCPTKKGKIPNRVALVSYADTIPKQWLNVFLIYSKMETDLKMAACVHPITRKVQVKQIAEFIAFYEQLGIEHFNFYECNATDDSIGFLQYLKDNGHSIKILPWNREFKSIDFNGSESEHIQDCLHRSVNKYSDVITIEVSDFFFPVEKVRLSEMVGNYRRSNGNLSELRLNCVDFCKAPNGTEDSTNMKNNVFRGNSRLSDTNYILAPDSAAAINFKDTFLSISENKSIINLSENYGIMHHFRNKCDKNVALVQDNSFLKYNKVLKKSLVFQKYWQATKGYVNV